MKREIFAAKAASNTTNSKETTEAKTSRPQQSQNEIKTKKASAVAKRQTTSRTKTAKTSKGAATKTAAKKSSARTTKKVSAGTKATEVESSNTKTQETAAKISANSGKTKKRTAAPRKKTSTIRSAAAKTENNKKSESTAVGQSCVKSETAVLVNTTPVQQEEKLQVNKMQGYYKLHAFIYDITRWTFLFGREKLLKMLSFEREDQLDILEIGCGTGKNIAALAKRFLNAHFTAFEVSPDMAKVTRKKLKDYQERVELIEKPYSSQIKLAKKFDVVLFSYSLTMINPQYAELIEQAKKDLKNGGIIAVVDFHDTPSKLYRNYMIFNHVKMESHLLPVLQKNFSTQHQEIKKGYAGVWQYFIYLGKK